MSLKQIETINRFQPSLFYLLEYLGQARTDSTFPLSWQSEFLHLSLRYTGRWTEREQLNAADKNLWKAALHGSMREAVFITIVS